MGSTAFAEAPTGKIKPQSFNPQWCHFSHCLQVETPGCKLWPTTLSWPTHRLAKLAVSFSCTTKTSHMYVKATVYSKWALTTTNCTCGIPMEGFCEKCHHAPRRATQTWRKEHGRTSQSQQFWGLHAAPGVSSLAWYHGVSLSCYDNTSAHWTAGKYTAQRKTGLESLANIWSINSHSNVDSIVATTM